MNTRQLQEAIDKTREWLNPQSSVTLTPSLKAKEDAVECLAQLQKIQCSRAAMITTPRITLQDIK